MVTNLARKWGAILIQPVARFLAKLGLTPNTVTVLGFLLTAAVAVVLASGRTQLAGLLLIGTLAFDAVDGTMARLMGTTSRFGAFLDSTLDRWAEVVIYAALVWLFLKNGQDTGVLLANAAMATSLLVSYTRARGRGWHPVQGRAADSFRTDAHSDRRTSDQPNHLGARDHRHSRGFHRCAAHLGHMASVARRGRASVTQAMACLC